MNTVRRVQGLTGIAVIAAAALLLLLLAPAGIRADTILKKDGSEVVGKILEEEPSRVLIEVQLGKMAAKIWVPRSEIASIERGSTPGEEFQTRLAALAPHDLAGHRELAAWAKERKLLAEEGYVNALLPRVELAAKKHENPRTWCRTCDADGQEICAHCAGEGKILAACVRCEGKGGFPCKTCDGSEDALVRCRRCAGEGEYEKFDPARGRKTKEKCDDCHGEGQVECPTCEGKGNTECPACKGSKGEMRPCEECAGKPKRVCSVCAGKGIQPTPVTDEQLAAEQTDAQRRAAEEAAAAAAAAAGKPAEGGAVPEPEKKPDPVVKGNPFGGGSKP